MRLIKVGVPEKTWLAPLPPRYQHGFTYEDEALIYITPAITAPKIARELKDREPSATTIIDAFAGIGGDSIGLASQFTTVLSTELDANRFYCLKQNVKAYRLEDRIRPLHADFCNTFAKYDTAAAVYMDPPWGGSNYLKNDQMHEDLPVMGIDSRTGRAITRSFNGLCVDLLNHGFPVIFAKVPTNFSTRVLSNSVSVREWRVFNKILMLEIRKPQSA